MKFKISRASSGLSITEGKPCKSAVQDGEQWAIELATLDEMRLLAIEVDEDLIVDFRDRPSITIYDHYVE